MPVQVQCMMLDAWDWCTGTTQRDGMGREEGGGFRMDFLLKIKKKKKKSPQKKKKRNLTINNNTPPKKKILYAHIYIEES